MPWRPPVGGWCVDVSPLGVALVGLQPVVYGFFVEAEKDALAVYAVCGQPVSCLCGVEAVAPQRLESGFRLLVPTLDPREPGEDPCLGEPVYGAYGAHASVRPGEPWRAVRVEAHGLHDKRGQSDGGGRARLGAQQNVQFDGADIAVAVGFGLSDLDGMHGDPVCVRDDAA